MSTYALVESVRRTLLADAGVKKIVGSRVFPSFPDIDASVKDGQWPILTVMIGGGSKIVPRHESDTRGENILVIESIHSKDDKKKLTDLHARVLDQVKPRIVNQFAQQGTDLKITVALMRLDNEEDVGFDQETDTYRFRAQYGVKFVMRN